MTDYLKLVNVLANGEVVFIIVGGAAAIAHGATRLTQDLDIVYLRTKANVSHLVAALAPYQPYPRGAPPGLPFQWDETTLWRGLNFTLTTSLGAIDLLGEITGGGAYENLLPRCVKLQLAGVACWCLGLEQLIESRELSVARKTLKRLRSWKLFSKL